MKKSNVIVSRCFIALVALAGAVSAQAQTSTARSDYTVGSAGRSYVGLSVGRSEFPLPHGSGLFRSENRDTAYSLSVGSYFSPTFGFEATYADLGSVRRGGGVTQAQGVQLALVGRLPLGQAFNLLGKVGTMYSRTEVSSAFGSGVGAGKEDDFGWSYGVGAEYAFTPQWSAVLQYDEHEMKFAGSGRDRINMTSLGMRYRF